MMIAGLVLFLLSPLAHAEQFDALKFVRDTYGEQDGPKTARCKAMNLDGSELVAELSATGNSMMKANIACAKLIDEKVKKKMNCMLDKAGPRLHFYVHRYDSGRWTKEGMRSSIPCRKPGEKLSRKCKATNPDGTELVGETVATGEDKYSAGAACRTLIDDKVRKIKCTSKNPGGTVKYAYHSEVEPGSWRKGVEESFKCR